MIVPRGVAKLLARKGFADVAEIDEGGEIRLGTWSCGRRMPTTTPTAARSGLVPRRSAFSSPGRTVSILRATPTSSTRWRCSPTTCDVALLPVAGWGPTVPAGHMDAARAAEALTSSAATDRDPDSLGNVGADLPPQPVRLGRGRRFAALARLAAPEVDVRVLGVGETMPLTD